MAKTLTFAGTNFLPQLVKESEQITEKIQNQTNVMNLQIDVQSGDNVPIEGSEVVFKDGARFLFGGYITKTTPTEYGLGSRFLYDVECSDYGFVFNNKVARRAYNNKTLKYIVDDLISEYVGSVYGFDTTNVATGPTISTIAFDHISVRKCFEKLSKLTGYVWYVDYEKNVYFIEKQQVAAGESITDSSENHEDILLDYDITQVANRLIVIGNNEGEQSNSTNVETFVADGETRSWELEDLPSEIVSITLGGVAQQFSLQVNERDTDDFLYTFNDKRVFLTDVTTTPTNPTEIVVTYYPRIPIIIQREKPSAIALMAVLDGGDGVFEKTIKDSSISSKDEARERAEQELLEFADPLLFGQFKTRTSLLSGTIFAPGQYLTVNLPSWGINTDTAFLIQEVTITLKEGEAGAIEYEYIVRFGGKVVDVETFLLTLQRSGADISNANEIKTIFGATDTVEFEDATPTIAKFTPPFQWGPGGSPQWVWNKSEWS